MQTQSPVEPPLPALDEPFFTVRLIEDPYPYYRRLQAEAPVHYDRDSGELLLTRYADVVTALKHPKLSSRRVAEAGLPMPAFLRGLMRPVSGVLARQMLFSDPPDHTRLRGLANRAFTPRVVQEMRGRIRQIAEHLLERAGRSGKIDLVREYSTHLPIQVIAEMLGVPAAHRARFKTWSDDLALFVGGSTLPQAVVLLRAARGVLQLHRYFRRLVRLRKRGNPGDDLLGALIRAEVEGDALTEAELIANAILLLAAGHETTTNLIGNGMNALLRNPEQLDLLRREPEWVNSAVEEFLRFESPVQWTGRVAVETVEIGGAAVRAGQTLAISVAAANRDPAVFRDPDRLDIRRAENPHLAFSHGIHFCLGAALARLEGQVAIQALLERFPKMRLLDQRPQWQANFTLRGLKSLRVAVD